MAVQAKDEDWFTRRHPARAADEKALRKLRRERDKAWRGRDRLKDHGTVEAAAKVQAGRGHAGSLARLYLDGHLSADQLAAAQEIRLIADRITRDVHIGTMSVETRVDNGGRGSGAFFEKLGAVRAEIAYTRWREELGAAAGAVLAIVVEDRACRATARASGMRDESLRLKLCEALDRWPRVCGTTCRDITPADLLAAQAGLGLSMPEY